MKRPPNVSLIVLAVLTAACSDASTAPKVPATFKIAAASATYVNGTVLTRVDPAPSVVVKDGNGRPVAGVSVKFRVQSGGGKATPDPAITDDNGVARADWVLGPVATSQPNNKTANVLWAYTNSLDSRVTFTATAEPGPPAQMTVIKSLPGDTLISGWEVKIYVRISDANDNFISGVPVSFTVTAGGSVAPDRTATDDFGDLTAEWVLGEPGENTVQVVSGDLHPMLLDLTALDPAGFTWYDLQTPTGCPDWVSGGVIGLAPGGKLAVRTDYPDGEQSAVLGHYTITGTSIWLYTNDYYEVGLFENNRVILQRVACDEYTPDAWIYNQRNGSTP